MDQKSLKEKLKFGVFGMATASKTSGLGLGNTGGAHVGFGFGGGYVRKASAGNSTGFAWGVGGEKSTVEKMLDGKEIEDSTTAPISIPSTSTPSPTKSIADVTGIDQDASTSITENDGDTANDGKNTLGIFRRTEETQWRGDELELAKDLLSSPQLGYPSSPNNLDEIADFGLEEDDVLGSPLSSRDRGQGSDLLSNELRTHTSLPALDTSIVAAPEQSPSVVTKFGGISDSDSMLASAQSPQGPGDRSASAHHPLSPSPVSPPLPSDSHPHPQANAHAHARASRATSERKPKTKVHRISGHRTTPTSTSNHFLSTLSAPSAPPTAYRPKSSHTSPSMRMHTSASIPSSRKAMISGLAETRLGRIKVSGVGTTQGSESPSPTRRKGFYAFGGLTPTTPTKEMKIGDGGLEDEFDLRADKDIDRTEKGRMDSSMATAVGTEDENPFIDDNSKTVHASPGAGVGSSRLESLGKKAQFLVSNPGSVIMDVLRAGVGRAEGRYERDDKENGGEGTGKSNEADDVAVSRMDVIEQVRPIRKGTEMGSTRHFSSSRPSTESEVALVDRPTALQVDANKQVPVPVSEEDISMEDKDRPFLSPQAREGGQIRDSSPLFLPDYDFDFSVPVIPGSSRKAATGLLRHIEQEEGSPIDQHDGSFFSSLASPPPDDIHEESENIVVTNMSPSQSRDKGKQASKESTKGRKLIPELIIPSRPDWDPETIVVLSSMWGERIAKNGRGKGGQKSVPIKIEAEVGVEKGDMSPPMSPKKGRGRPKGLKDSIPIKADAAVEVEKSDASLSMPFKRGRGRPKGSKNKNGSKEKEKSFGSDPEREVIEMLSDPKPGEDTYLNLESGVPVVKESARKRGRPRKSSLDRRKVVKERNMEPEVKLGKRKASMRALELLEDLSGRGKGKRSKLDQNIASISTPLQGGSPSQKLSSSSGNGKVVDEGIQSVQSDELNITSGNWIHEDIDVEGPSRISPGGIVFDATQIRIRASTPVRKQALTSEPPSPTRSTGRGGRRISLGVMTDADADGEYAEEHEQREHFELFSFVSHQGQSSVVIDRNTEGKDTVEEGRGEGKLTEAPISRKQDHDHDQDEAFFILTGMVKDSEYDVPLSINPQLAKGINGSVVDLDTTTFGFRSSVAPIKTKRKDTADGTEVDIAAFLPASPSLNAAFQRERKRRKISSGSGSLLPSGFEPTPVSGPQLGTTLGIDAPMNSEDPRAGFEAGPVETTSLARSALPTPLSRLDHPMGAPLHPNTPPPLPRADRPAPVTDEQRIESISKVVESGSVPDAGSDEPLTSNTSQPDGHAQQVSQKTLVPQQESQTTTVPLDSKPKPKLKAKSIAPIAFLKFAPFAPAPSPKPGSSSDLLKTSSNPDGSQIVYENPEDDPEFEGYDEGPEGLKTVCHHCQDSFELNKMQCFNPQPDRTFCHKQWCRNCINTWYLLEFDWRTTGFICPFCQGLCCCDDCRPENGRAEFPLAIDPYAPSLIASYETRESYVPPTFAKQAWKMNQRAWKVMHGLAKLKHQRVRKSSYSGKGKGKDLGFLKPPPGEFWYIGRNRWLEGPDPEWEQLRMLILRSRPNTVRSVQSLPPPQNGKLEYVGKAPPSPGVSRKIPYLHMFRTARPSRREEVEDGKHGSAERIPEFTYPDLPPPGLQGLIIDRSSVGFNSYGSHDPSHSQTPIDLSIDPQLISSFKNYGNGADMALGELQHLPEGVPNLTYQYRQSSSDFHSTVSPHTNQDHHTVDHENSRDAEEYDNGWNTNVIYSFNHDGELVLPGEGHNPEGFRKALEAGLHANGVIPLWQAPFQGRLEENST